MVGVDRIVSRLASKKRKRPRGKKGERERERENFGRDEWSGLSIKENDEKDISQTDSQGEGSGI
jgi:hypothetical protein